jgi:hypothetical protein
MEKPKYSQKTRPSATLSTINPNDLSRDQTQAISSPLLTYGPPNVFLFGRKEGIKCGRKLPFNSVSFEVFTAVTMKNVVFWEKKIPVRTSQETHYISVTEPS